MKKNTETTNRKTQKKLEYLTRAIEVLKIPDSSIESEINLNIYKQNLFKTNKK